GGAHHATQGGGNKKGGTRSREPARRPRVVSCPDPQVAGGGGGRQAKPRPPARSPRAQSHRAGGRGRGAGAVRLRGGPVRVERGSGARGGSSTSVRGRTAQGRRYPPQEPPGPGRA